MQPVQLVQGTSEAARRDDGERDGGHLREANDALTPRRIVIRPAPDRREQPHEPADPDPDADEVRPLDAEVEPAPSRRVVRMAPERVDQHREDPRHAECEPQATGVASDEERHDHREHDDPCAQELVGSAGGGLRECREC